MFRQLALPVRGHQHLDVSSRVEPVQLIDQFQHRPLDLIIATCTIIKPRATDSVYFVKEDDTCLLAPCHFEQLSDHACTFTNVLLHKLRTDDANEGSIRTISNSAST